MVQRQRTTHVHVLSLDEMQGWYQPFGVWRECFQARLVARVVRAAARRGAVACVIFDAFEQELWRGEPARGD